MADGPRPPFPAVMRDSVEHELWDVEDREIARTVRRLVANAYAHGFQDGELHQLIVAGHDQRAEEQAAKKEADG